MLWLALYIASLLDLLALGVVASGGYWEGNGTWNGTWNGTELSLPTSMPTGVPRYPDFDDAFETYSKMDINASVVVRNVSASMDVLQEVLGGESFGLEYDIHTNLSAYREAILTAVHKAVSAATHYSNSTFFESQVQNLSSYVSIHWSEPTIFMDVEEEDESSTLYYSSQPSILPTPAPSSPNRWCWGWWCWWGSPYDGGGYYTNGTSPYYTNGSIQASTAAPTYEPSFDPSAAPTSTPSTIPSSHPTSLPTQSYITSFVDMSFTLHINFTLSSGYRRAMGISAEEENVPEVFEDVVKSAILSKSTINSLMSNSRMFSQAVILTDDLELPPTLKSDFSRTSQSTRFYLLGDWGKGGLSGDKLAYFWNSTASTYQRKDSTAGQRRRLPEDEGNEHREHEGEHDEHDHEHDEEHDHNHDHDHEHGGNEMTYQAAIGRGMATYAESQAQLPPSFVLALGDNFYNDGVESANDSQWNTTWCMVYHCSHPDELMVKWYGVIGNHDWGYGLSGVQAQVDRTTATDDDLWEMPSTNYTRIIDLDNDQGSLVIVSIDTTTLAPSENECCGEEKWKKSVIRDRIAQQLQRTELGLQWAWKYAPRPMWLMVAGHYPIFSVGEHGDTEELVEYLNPLLDQYKVHAYVCGHDHFSAHLSKPCNDSSVFNDTKSCFLKGKRWTTHHFIAGGGALIDDHEEDSTAETHWSGLGYSSYATVSLNSLQFHIAYRDIYGNITYAYECNHAAP